MHKKSLSVILILLLLGSLLAACSEPTAPAADLSPVRLQLGWVPTIEYSPFYVADREGLFAQQGITVEFMNGGFDESGQPIDTIERVVSGEADFGMASADRLLLARAEGAPLVAIGTLYQRSPIAFISLAESGITKPQDFVGRNVFVDETAGSTGIAYIAMMSSLGIDRSEINEIQRDDFSNEALISGRVDVMSAFINNQPVQLRLEGYEVNTILASDYGIDLYANVIFTTEERIANQPDLVNRFLRPAVAGIDAAVSDPPSAVEATLAHGEDLDLESETQSMQQALPLFKPAGSNAGMMSDSVWGFTYETMVTQGLIPASLNVSDAFTLQFLNEIYGS